MARLKEIIANKLYVGYNFIDAYYYVINQDTITSRLTAKEAYDIVIVIDPASAYSTTLFDEIIAMASTLETLTNIYYALEDNGLGIRAVWFNTYRYYPLLYDGNTMSIGNTDIVYTISTYSIRDKIVRAFQNFYLTKIGINISFEELTALYNYLVNTSFNKPVYNTIAERVSATDPLYYSNQLSTLTNAKVTYIATYNPEEEYTYNTNIGEVEGIDRNNKRIILKGTPAVTIQTKDKIKLDGATLYMSGGNYSDDGLYTVNKIENLIVQDPYFTWHNNSVGYQELLSEYNSEEAEEFIEGEEDWEQPLATSDTTVIEGGNMVFTCSSACSGYDAYKAFDGVKSGTTTTTGWGTNNLLTGWWQVQFPYKIKITEIKGYQRCDSTPANANTIGQFYTSSSKETPIGDEYNNAVGVNWNEVSVTGIPEEGIITDTIYFDKTGGGVYGGFGELEITATKITSEFPVRYKLTPKNYKIASYSQLNLVDNQYLKNHESQYYMFGALTNDFKTPTSDNKVITNQAIVTEEQIPYDYNSLAYVQSMKVEDQTITLNTKYETANLTEGTQIKIAGANGEKYLSSNVTKVGAVADVDGVLSNFTSSNYVNTPTINFNSANNWEISFKTVVNSNLTTNQGFCGSISNYGMLFRVSTDGKFQWYISSSTSSWNIVDGTKSNNLIIAAQPYWIKLKFTGTQYIMEYSTDGTNYDIGICINSTTKVASTFSALKLGTYDSSNILTYGSIDLNYSYVKLNDETVWEGTNTQPYTCDGTYTVVRSYLNDDLNTVMVVNNTLTNNYTASKGIYPVFDLVTRPTTKKGTAGTDMLLNVITSANEAKFPTGEFMLDSPSQLTEYIQLGNAQTNNIIPVPTEYNYSHINKQIPSYIPTSETGLSKNMELAGLFTEVYSSK